jgi:hypothetical protein
MQFTPPRVPCTVPRGETAGSSDPAAVGEGWRAEGRRLVQDASRVHTLFLLARVSPDLTGSKCRAINQSAGRKFWQQTKFMTGFEQETAFGHERSV